MWDLGQRGTVTGFAPSTSGFPYRYNSTKASHSFTHISLTLYILIPERFIQ